MDRDTLCQAGAVLGLLLASLGVAWSVHGGSSLGHAAIAVGLMMVGPSLKGGDDSPLTRGVRQRRMFRLTLGIAAVPFTIVMALAALRLIAER